MTHLLGNRSSRRGSALILVLVSLLLLTILVVGFLTRSTLEKQLSTASVNFGKADLAAQGAVSMVIGDLQEEIVAGSGTVTPYYPNSPLTVIPCISGGFTPTPGSGLEDLVKISKNGQAFYINSGTNTYYNLTKYPAPNRAAPVSTGTQSLNSRSITPARWNKPLYLTKATLTSTTDLTPVSAFVSPDWIYVARDGSNPVLWDSSYTYVASVSPTTTPAVGKSGTNAVTQRYAYAIYDEGSTLDMNVVGSPVTGTTAAPSSFAYSQFQPYKGALAYADLTQLPYLSALNATQQRTFINALLGWRNNATVGPTISTYFPSYTGGGFLPVGTGTISNFDTLTLSSRNGFLSLSSGSLVSTTHSLVAKSQSDNSFVGRQQLIQFLSQGMGQNATFLTASGLTVANLQNLLPYLGTFSRDINQPSYAPPAGRPTVLPAANGGNSGFNVDAQVNPALLSVTVPASGSFVRNNGASVTAGEPLFNRRFALNRIAWVTYKGPSASRTLTDLDMKALIAGGIPASYLALGTATNIQNYFGLNWDSTNNRWKYNVHNGASGTGPTGVIMQLGKIAALNTPHEPDFFEILKATIGVGSLAKALVTSGSVTLPDAGASYQEQPNNYSYYVESSVDMQIVQIGANIICQFQPATYPVQIVFDDGSGQVYVPRTIVGSENLPYLSVVMTGALQLQAPIPLPRNLPYSTGTIGWGMAGSSGYTTASTDSVTLSGVGAMMQEPVIWNPYDPSSPSGVVGPTKFRVLADSATPDAVINSGTYSSFFVYSCTQGVSPGSNFSYAASPKTPGAWFVDNSGTSTGTYTGFSIKHQFQNPPGGVGNSEIDFTVTPNATTPLEICPEPMMLMRAATVKDSSLSAANSIVVSVPSNAFMRTDTSTPVTSFLVGSGFGVGFKNYIANAPQMASSETIDSSSTPYIGFYMGAFPFAWYTTSPGAAAISGCQSGPYLARYTGLASNPAGSNSACYMTYRLQYSDTSTGTWVTYDTKYGKAYLGGTTPLGICPPIAGPPAFAGVPGALIGAGDWGYVTDPRTSRFGIMASFGNDFQANFSTGQGHPLPGPELSFWANPVKYAAGWLDTANALMYTIRPDGESGFFCKSAWNPTVGPSSGWMAFIGSNTSTYPGLAPGLLSQNNTDTPYMSYRFYGDTQGLNRFAPEYFADPDGMVRRAMGAFTPTGTSTSPEVSPPASGFAIPPVDNTTGLPMARAFGWATSSPQTPSTPNPCITAYTGPTQKFSQAQSRPYFLHRPFYSVAELGYVFSDTPWRNLDFFTAESGNSALLDAFCVRDTLDANGLVAGKINLNTRQIPTLQAVLAEAYLDPVQPTVSTSGYVGQLDAATASSTANWVAKALVARTTDTLNVLNGTGPLQNLSELIGKWRNNLAINDLGGLITGPDVGTLSSGSGFYDGKLSYTGFSGGVWDTSNHKPYQNGVENVNTGTTVPTGTAEDIYSAYMSSANYSSATGHNGTQETMAYIQRFREAPVRALSAVGTTRVWNLMIDVIAQTGRFPSSVSNLANFNVEGERRYWVHLAIDRLTGKVLDEQIEEVKE